jgi:hypothetical protein
MPNTGEYKLHDNDDKTIVPPTWVLLIVIIITGIAGIAGSISMLSGFIYSITNSKTISIAISAALPIGLISANLYTLIKKKGAIK